MEHWWNYTYKNKTINWEKCFPVQEKVKFTLEKAKKAQRGSRGIALLFFNFGPRRGGWSTPRHGRFTPGKDLVPHCTGGWVGLRAALDGCGKFRPHRDSIPGPCIP